MTTGAPCPRCGNQRPADAVFCPKCGFNFAGESFSERYGTTPAVASAPEPKSSSSWRTAVLGLGAILVIGVGALAFVALAQPGGRATPTTRPAPTAATRVTEPPAFTAPPEEIVAVIGEAVPLVDGDGADLGTVTVTSGKKYTKVGEYLVVDKGKAWVGAKVRYAAEAPFLFNLFDWVAHDDEGNQYQPSGFALDPQLEAGTLAKGRKIQGWVPFEVPSGTKKLWVDYAPSGTVIFSVQVLPAK